LDFFLAANASEGDARHSAAETAIRAVDASFDKYNT